jgi:4-amino-4-deoxy-L-arabinose transferase-like glycosyltransferase
MLSLLLFGLGLAGIPFTLAAVTLLYLALMLPGWALWLRAGRPGARIRMPHALPARLALMILLALSGAVLFNAAYWPFYREDALGIYARYARLMWESGTLVPFAGRDDAFYQAYPMLIPLNYTYAYLASGWPNEYLARVIAALLSLSCLPAVYLLGHTIRDETAGWLAALLLGLTPMFGRWASSGYVDLPMAFFYTLAALFLWRLWAGGAASDALLAGICLGLAAWTKNAALLGVVFSGLWLLYGLWQRRFGWRTAASVLAVTALIAVPWYLRNWLETGLIVPPTAWVDQAERSLRTLLALITQPENFGLSGWMMLIGTLWAVDRARRQDGGWARLLLLWTMPFFGVWWLLTSYDPRFILLFLPPLAVLGGSLLSAFGSALPLCWQPRTFIVTGLLALLLAAPVIWTSVEYKNAILANPLMDDAQKRAVVLQR